MQRILLLFFLSITKLYSQTVEISGRILNTSEVENIHVINKTLEKYTVTNKLGEFKIIARLNDTLVISSIKYKRYTTIFSEENISNKSILILLQEQVNELDEVLIGKVLTGDLMSDVQNSDAKPNINFYDVGIPGYTGKPKTQSERRLYEASDLNPTAGGSLGGVGGSVSLGAVINALTGRTKMLKERVAIETKHDLMLSIKARLSKDFFASNPLDEDHKMDFFFFCSDDKNFMKYCKNKSDFEVLIFLRYKYKAYLENQITNKE